KRGADQFTSLSSEVTRQTQESTQQARQNMQVMTQSGAVLASGYQDVSREWLAMSQALFQKNLDGLNAMMRCRSLPELIATQSSLVRDNMELTIENSRRIAKLSVGVADKAGRSFEEQTSKNSERSKRAA
ncbi:phasin family protein, partial [Aurantimonas sp. A2-1-M11]|uniref:phasin family protein n=1 Tax=Aurantimonas sp. A2-1-M11 TaxID=3113712 RepID=UPI002F9544D8